MADRQATQENQPNHRPQHGDARQDYVHHPEYARERGRFKHQDLREKLNRLRQERGPDVGKEPPPDPPNSFLKDPYRDEVEDKGLQTKNDGKQSNYYRKNNKVGEKSGEHVDKTYRTKQFFHTKQKNENVPKHQKINLQNPINIKVEVAASTGERSCTLDVSTKLPEIKHVPDKQDYRQRFGHNKQYFKKPWQEAENKNQPGKNATRKNNTKNENYKKLNKKEAFKEAEGSGEQREEPGKFEAERNDKQKEEPETSKKNEENGKQTEEPESNKKAEESSTRTVETHKETKDLKNESESNSAVSESDAVN